MRALVLDIAVHMQQNPMEIDQRLSFFIGNQVSWSEIFMCEISYYLKHSLSPWMVG